MNKDDNIHKEEAHLQWTNEQVYTFSCFYKKEREYALNLEEKINLYQNKYLSLLTHN